MDRVAADAAIRGPVLADQYFVHHAGRRAPRVPDARGPAGELAVPYDRKPGAARMDVGGGALRYGLRHRADPPGHVAVRDRRARLAGGAPDDPTPGAGLA